MKYIVKQINADLSSKNSNTDTGLIEAFNSFNPCENGNIPLATVKPIE